MPRTPFLLVALMIAAVSSHAAPVAAPTARISARHADARIRADLLAYTPIGSPIGDVLDFARQRLIHEGEVVVGQNNRFHLASVAALLGHFRQPLNLFFPTYVRVHWVFDRHDRLQDVRIDRYVEAW